MLRKTVSGILIFIIVFLAVLVIFGGRALEDLTQRILDRQQFAEGTITAESLQANWNGTVRARNLQWQDAKGVTLARVPEAAISVNLFEAIIKGGSEASIQKIYLHQPELYLACNDGEPAALAEKIDDLNNKQQIFRGEVKADGGKLHLQTPAAEFVFDNVQLMVNFKNAGTVSGNVSGTYMQAPVALNFKTGQQHEYKLEGSKIPLKDLLSAYGQRDSLALQDGLLNITVNFSDSAQKPMTSVSGSLEKGEGSLFGLPLKEIYGDFHGDLQELSLTKGGLQLADQPLNLHGKILLPAGARKETECELQFDSGSFALKALSKGINITEGVTVRGNLRGVLRQPIMEGTFGIKTLDFPPLAIEELHGNFLYFAQQLHIANAAGRVADGTVKADGRLNLQNGQFKFDLAGENIPAELLTDKQLSGNYSFETTVLGSNVPDSSVAAGRFTVQGGSFKGISFSSVSGSVTHDKNGYRFSDTYLHTFLGNIPLDALLLDNGKLRFSE